MGLTEIVCCVTLWRNQHVSVMYFVSTNTFSKWTLTEKVACRSDSFSYSTFTHPPVLTKHVACWTFALVGAHHINTAEGTQQRILGTLIDVCAGSRRQQVTIVVQQYKDYVMEVTKFHIPSQVIIGPGSKPLSHAHSKPPMALVHVPLPQGLPMSHSSVSALKTDTLN